MESRRSLLWEFLITTPEALAVLESVSLTDDLYERRIFVASDWKIIINDIKQKSVAVYDAIIREIIDCSSLFTSCYFGHVWLGNPGDLTFVL